MTPNTRRKRKARRSRFSNSIATMQNNIHSNFNTFSLILNITLDIEHNQKTERKGLDKKKVVGKAENFALPCSPIMSWTPFFLFFSGHFPMITDPQVHHPSRLALQSAWCEDSAPLDPGHSSREFAVLLSRGILLFMVCVLGQFPLCFL